jgi:uncharacterized 2Fe-2S/4Fe-4S cluster protein (DUF4445 family)
MAKKKKGYTVVFLPDKKEITASKGANLLSCAIRAGMHLHSSCGGDGVCGRCKVVVKKGDFKTEPTGRLTTEEKKKGYVLACLTTIQGDLTVRVPAESRLDMMKISEEDAKFLRLKGIYSKAEEADAGKAIIDESIYSHSPLATKVYLELPPPTLEDNISDLERLYREIRKSKDVIIMQTGLTNIKRLGSLLRHSDWKITTTLGKRNETTEIVVIEPGNTSGRNYGIAFDIGTTTVTGQLVNLNTRKILGTKATYNKQVAFGSDVISRIIFASEGDGLERLHHAVIDNMNEIIKELVHENRVNLSDVMGVMCAGNSTMVHLLLRVDPRFIRREPYVSTANYVPVIRAAESGIKIHPRGLLSCVPGVSTYVGGDITAGVVASGMADEDKVTLLIDIGTNGEIVLGNKDWLVCCSASAGPAFEGSGVTCGMRATKCAIQRVRIKDKSDGIKIATIGKGKPCGICGSGYIDILAELFKNGIIDKDGKFDTAIQSDRVRKGEEGLEYVVCFKKDAEIESDIVITETDIENLKRSKGAIYAAASILLRKVGLPLDAVDRIMIAGGFGTTIDIEKAITIGLLPDVDRSKFIFIGNSSLIGSREILLSYEAMQKAEQIAGKMTYVELSTEPRYMDEYVASLFFPHTDITRFPSAKEGVHRR